MSRRAQILVGTAVAVVLLLSVRALSQPELPSSLHYMLQTGSAALCSGRAYASSRGPSWTVAAAHAAQSPAAAQPDTRLRILHLIDEPTMQALMDRSVDASRNQS